LYRASQYTKLTTKSELDVHRGDLYSNDCVSWSVVICCDLFQIAAVPTDP
jgi:hypothetical protein